MKKFLLIICLVLVSAISLFANITAEEILNVKVEADSIIVTIAIPESMHLTIQKDYFYLDVDPVEGVIFEETIYPQGEPDKDGYVNLHGTVHLIKKFTLADDIDKDEVIFKIYTGFQLCYDSYCEPPVDAEFTLPLIPKKQ